MSQPSPSPLGLSFNVSVRWGFGPCACPRCLCSVAMPLTGLLSCCPALPVPSAHSRRGPHAQGGQGAVTVKEAAGGGGSVCSGLGRGVSWALLFLLFLAYRSGSGPWKGSAASPWCSEEATVVSVASGLALSPGQHPAWPPRGNTQVPYFASLIFVGAGFTVALVAHVLGGAQE